MLMESQAIPVAILTGIFVKKRALADQIHDLRKVAELRGWEVIEVVKRHGGNEDMDGDLDGAAGLRRVLELARSGRIQKALVDEVAGVAGSNRLVCAFLEELVGSGISLYWHALEMETLMQDGKVSPAGFVLSALMEEMTRSATEQRRKRILFGLEKAKKRGKILGRPRGSRDTSQAVLRRYREVVGYLEAGNSLRKTARLAGISQGTVQKVKKIMRQQTAAARETTTRVETAQDEGSAQSGQLPVNLL